MEKIIFKSFLREISFFFILSSISIALIIWIVQAVNYLDFVSEDGHNFKVYFFYIILILPKIFSRILPFMFFISIFYIILKYEEKNQLLIFWSNGIDKKKFLNIGTNKLIQYFGKMKPGTRIAIQIKTTQPELTAKEISREDIKDYWGYSVKERSNLLSILSTWKGKIILTSKKGTNFTVLDAKKMIESNEPILIVFGTTNKGIHDILGTDIKKIQNSKIFNFFPNQATQTVRLEEAILGILSIINILDYN